MLSILVFIHLFGGSLALTNLERSSLEPYAPYPVQCPSDSLVRSATGINVDEALYVSQRKKLASGALQTWLAKSLKSSDLQLSNAPTVALAMSGGGPKAELLALGAMHALDGRDSSVSTSGLLQGITYAAGLSGGSVTLGSVITNDNARASDMKTKFFDTNSQNPFTLALTNIGQIVADLGAKTLAGYPSTIIDLYGRAISYDYFGGRQQGGNAVTWSSVFDQSSFAAHQAPFPLVTISNAFVEQGQCQPNTTGAVWEFSPFEFGSWDPSVYAFTPSNYLGTSMSNGSALVRGTCTNGFDIVGLFAGMSCNTFPTLNPNCTSSANQARTPITELNEILTQALPALSLPSVYGIIPNPFYNYALSRAVRSQKSLYMVDGGFAGQGIPLMPFLQPHREIDVIIAIDSASFAGNLTDGTSIYNTYAQAQRYGLTRAPRIPAPEVYEKQRLAYRAQVFGCYDENVVTMVYIPDTNMTAYGSNLLLTPAQIDDMYRGGADMVTQTDDGDWPGCLACAIAHKSVEGLGERCGECLERYCWKD